MPTRSSQLRRREHGMGAVCGPGVQHALRFQCLPGGVRRKDVRTWPCTARRKDVPSPPALGTRWTWVSSPRRDAVCANKRAHQTWVSERTPWRPVSSELGGVLVHAWLM
ncbi:hypothetical protein PIB30_035433 [Stylosanthes scabra]|uniref:Uncharacterized protein n=1 Tax=Stylosanthes scabra TaxID=79078 RepID=A0ABU6SDJ6_9FABA|nr:hypothetical protein [Stylosanthes scabra]